MTPDSFNRLADYTLNESIRAFNGTSPFAGRSRAVHHINKLLVEYVDALTKIGVDAHQACVESLISHCRGTLIKKGDEYSTEGDKLHNFKKSVDVAKKLYAQFELSPHITPLTCLIGFALKHHTSIADIMEGTQRNVTKELLDEKFGDAINYYVLADAIEIENGVLKAPIDCYL